MSAAQLGVRRVRRHDVVFRALAGLTIGSSLLGIDGGFQVTHARFGSAAAVAYLVAAAVVPMTVIVLRVRTWLRKEDKALARLSVCGLSDFAALLAGRKRPGLRDEWRAHLVGESGHDPVTWRKAIEALGFVASALRCRCTDAADAAWIPVDAILRSRKLSNLLVLGPTAVAAMYILRHLGTAGVLTSAESISALGGILYGLVRVGRWWRDVKPSEPKARRAAKER
jgi:hypothetical protein